jgi:hypothetical protein
MKKNKVHKKNQWVLSFCFGLGLPVLIALLMGCAGIYGRFVYDEAVDDVFEQLSVLPDHNYYYSGPDSYPDVIIAIDEKYTLASKLWKPIEITAAQLKKWVFYPSRRAQYYPYTYGRRILDDQGNRIGVWYSLQDYRAFATIRMLDANTVQLSTPIDEGHRRQGPYRRSVFFDGVLRDSYPAQDLTVFFLSGHLEGLA